MRYVGIIVVLALSLASCGRAGPDYPDDVVTQAPPTVSRIEPTSGPGGTAISIYGFGFSVAAPTNIVVIGDRSVSAETYRLLDAATSTEIECLTATIPDDAPAGESTIAVVVYENVSNATETFTVTP